MWLLGLLRRQLQLREVELFDVIEDIAEVAIPGCLRIKQAPRGQVVPKHPRRISRTAKGL